MCTDVKSCPPLIIHFFLSSTHLKAESWSWRRSVLRSIVRFVLEAKFMGKVAHKSCSVDWDAVYPCSSSAKGRQAVCRSRCAVVCSDSVSHCNAGRQSTAASSSCCTDCGFNFHSSRTTSCYPVSYSHSALLFWWC